MSSDPEEAVISVLLRSPSSLPEIQEIVGNGAGFTSPDCRLAYQTIVGLAKQGVTPDAVSVMGALKKAGLADGPLTPGRLATFTGMGAPVLNAKYYARDIATAYESSKLLAFLEDAQRGLVAGSESPKAVLASLLAMTIDTVTDHGDGVIPVSAGTAKVLDALEEQEKHEGPGAFAGVDSGFEAVNKVTGGYQRGHLNLIAAQPSQGKTSLALASARCIAGAGERCVFFSMEMPEQEINMRLLAMESRVDILRMRNANKLRPLDNDEWQRLAMAQKTLSDLDSTLVIDDSGTLDVAAINNRIERLNTTSPDLSVRVVFIDYLQLMDCPGENLTHGLSVATKELKQTAKRWTSLGKDLTVVLLSQLTKPRQDEMRNGVPPRPSVRDIRDSNQILANCDLVALLYRRAPYLLAAGRPVGEDAKKAELIIAKQRNGPIGTIPLHFEGEFTLFHDQP